MPDTTIANNGALPTSDFSFSQAFSNLGNFLKPVVQTYAETWGQVQIAKANASAQAELTKLKQANPTLGSNQPAAAQKEADKTLAEKWLPTGQSGTTNLVSLMVLGFGLLIGLLIVRKLMK